MTVLAAPAVGESESPWDKRSGTSVSFVVMDGTSGEIWAAREAHAQYRSASLVKLLIALDYFDSRGPGVEVPESDRALLESMLRSSDDEAASELWSHDGWETIVVRMADRLGLTDTKPPVDRRVWGYTATSALDVARIYEYLLNEADPAVSEFIVGSLRRATRCAADGQDQYFGIPTRVAMHTSGVIGAGHGMIVVLLSLHPPGAAYQDCAEQVTAITRALYLAVKASPADPLGRRPDVQSRWRASP